VDGYKRDGTRIRENFLDLKQVEARKLELVMEWAAGHSETGLRATKLNNEKLRLAEWAYIRLGAPTMSCRKRSSTGSRNPIARCGPEPRTSSATE
jgi:hypothetical protein